MPSSRDATAIQTLRWQIANDQPIWHPPTCNASALAWTSGMLGRSPMQPDNRSYGAAGSYGLRSLRRYRKIPNSGISQRVSIIFIVVPTASTI